MSKRDSSRSGRLPTIPTPTLSNSPLQAPSIPSDIGDRCPEHPSRGVSNGALGGAIVASVIGAALLTFLATFFFLRPRSRSSSDKEIGPRQGRKRRNSSRGTVALGAISAYTATSRRPDRLVTDLDKFIRPSADDQTARNRVLTLFDQVANHVENHYVLISESRICEPDVSHLSRYDTPNLPAPLVNLLAKSHDPRPIIKHCLMWTMLSAVLPGYLPPLRGSFLPSVYAACPVSRGSATDPSELSFSK